MKTKFTAIHNVVEKKPFQESNPSQYVSAVNMRTHATNLFFSKIFQMKEFEIDILCGFHCKNNNDLNLNKRDF